MLRWLCSIATYSGTMKSQYRTAETTPAPTSHVQERAIDLADAEDVLSLSESVLLLGALGTLAMSILISLQ